jgi:hypothetical protein
MITRSGPPRAASTKRFVSFAFRASDFAVITRSSPKTPSLANREYAQITKGTDFLGLLQV